MVQFGRRDADARGHSGRKHVPRIPNARSWRPGQPWGEGDTRYTVEIPKGGLLRVYDRKAGKHVPYPSGTGFVVPRWNIDHAARLQFTVKTLLGIGWKVFGCDLLAAVDLELLRWVLTSDFQVTTDNRECATADFPKEGRLIYVNPFLVPSEQREIHPLTKIEPVLVRKGQTTLLIRQLDDSLEWSVACLGYVVGSVRVRLRVPLIKGGVHPGGGMRLVIHRDRLQSEVVGRSIEALAGVVSALVLSVVCAEAHAQGGALVLETIAKWDQGIKVVGQPIKTIVQGEAGGKVDEHWYRFKGDERRWRRC